MRWTVRDVLDREVRSVKYTFVSADEFWGCYWGAEACFRVLNSTLIAISTRDFNELRSGLLLTRADAILALQREG